MNLQERIEWLLESSISHEKLSNTEKNFETVEKFIENHLDKKLFKKKVHYKGKIYERPNGKKSSHSFVEFQPYYADNYKPSHTEEGKAQLKDYYEMRNKLVPEVFRHAKALKLLSPTFKIRIRKGHSGAAILVSCAHWL